jgi:NADH-quinone oxidoreductase subunit G
MATIYIDNNSYEVPQGKNLLETCLTLGFDVPYFCWHPALGSVGACRQCAVKLFRDESDKKGRLIMSCMEPVVDHQRISIDDAEAREFRENVIGWLMTNHPHDCAICDEGGSCHLQDMTVMTGHSYRKFSFKKRTYQNQYLGPFLNHEMNRCIQCYRCVRFYKDYAGGHDLDVFASRNRVYFGRVEDGTLENEFSGNLAEVCPTGVFTDKTLKQHYTRKWDLTMAPSICQHCSLGCNTIAGERYGSLRTIGNRYHGEVNGYFLCDRGRFGYEFVNADTRIRRPQRQNGMSHEVDADRLMNEISLLRNTRMIGIGSARASLESNYVLQKLVGEMNFYHGVSARENRLTALIHNIISSGVRCFSMKEVEKADAVFILGEDITNTAPMLALAVRQAIRRQPMKNAINIRIPEWNDAAIREMVQDEKGPLFITSFAPTRLDEVATISMQRSPDTIARIGFAVAHFIDNGAPGVPDLTPEEHRFAEAVADSLMKAENPVVISGVSSGSDAIIKAAANVDWALHQKSKGGIVFSFSECNSLGLALMGDHAFEKISEDAETLFVLETDLYRHAEEKWVDKFLSRFKNVIVIDHTRNKTTQKATVVIPAGTFAESDGTIVNNEGRAQRYFQVYEPANGILESWRWLINLGKAMHLETVAHWNDHDDVTRSLANEHASFKGIDYLAPSADFRINGQKVPRQPHRYSGRTAMLANINVSEPKPPEDHDSPLSYTMEGTKSRPPSSMIPFFWSPGWNSIQSVNKYQEEVGGHLSGGDPGIHLIKQEADDDALLFTDIPRAFQPSVGQWLIVPLYHIFGSEEQSSFAGGVQERAPQPYVGLNEDDAKKLARNVGDLLQLKVSESSYLLPMKVVDGMPPGVAGLAVGLRGMPFYNLPEWGSIK